jgi:hypothetical protein
MKIKRNAILISTVALCIGMSTGAFAESFNDRGILIIEKMSAGSPGLGTTPVLFVRGFNDRGIGFIPDATVGSRRPREQLVVTLSGGFNNRGSYFASRGGRYPTGSAGGNRIVDAR